MLICGGGGVLGQGSSAMKENYLEIHLDLPVLDVD